MYKILVINSGSATLKFKIFENKNGLKELRCGLVDRIGLSYSIVSVKNEKGKVIFEKKYKAGIKNHKQAVDVAVETVKYDLKGIKYIGHRVVHGGNKFTLPTRINKQVYNELKKYNKLAPLHNPVNLEGIERCFKLFSGVSQYAVFDTSYYFKLPDYRKQYPLSDYFFKKGIEKYGFHGISHKYACRHGAVKSGILKNKIKIITCHLGGGASMTANLCFKNTQTAIDTSMGFTPLEGLMMSTRSGDIDPAIVMYMINELKIKPQKVADILNKESGLLAVAGTKDMREILAAAGQKVTGYTVNTKFTHSQKEKATLALNMFIDKIVGYAGKYYALLGGLDLLVFTGGVGENSPVIRKMITDKIKHFGKFKTVVVKADEEREIAQEIILHR